MKELIRWALNKKKIENEIVDEDNQYNKILIENGKLKKENQKLSEELEHQIKLKNIYLSNCKRYKRKIKELTNENIRKDSKRSTCRKQKSTKR